jgi:nicotinic acid phosphoribosyltransferase
MTDNEKEVTLRVQEAYHRDVGRGIARIDMETMRHLGMVSGDIIEIEGKPFTKRGKWSGSKRVLACAQCGARKIVPFARAEKIICTCGGAFIDLLVPVFDNGKELIKTDPPAKIREFALQQVKGLKLAEERK